MYFISSGAFESNVVLFARFALKLVSLAVSELELALLLLALSQSIFNNN